MREPCGGVSEGSRCGIIPGRETGASPCQMCSCRLCSCRVRGAPRQPRSSGPLRGDGGGGGGGGRAGGPQSGVSRSEHHHQPPGFSQRAGTTSSTPHTFHRPSCASGSHRDLVDYKNPIATRASLMMSHPHFHPCVVDSQAPPFSSPFLRKFALLILPSVPPLTRPHFPSRSLPFAPPDL